MIDFFLRPTVDLEGYGLIEFEHWAAVECRKRLPIEFKFDRHHSSRRFSVDFISFFSISCYFPNLRFLKNGGIKLHSLLRVTIEPQTRCDFLHGCSFDLIPVSPVSRSGRSKSTMVPG